MDGRWTQQLLAGVLLVAVGCTPDKLLPKGPAGNAPSAAAPVKELAKASQVYPEPITLEPVKELKPKTLVAFAALREQMAAEIARAPAQKEAFLEDARKAYHKALAADPNYLPAHMGLAKHWEMVGKPDRALECFEKARKVAPQDAGLHFEMAMCYARTKAWDKALPLLHRAVELEPANRKFSSSYALMLARAERFEESLGWLKKLYGEAEAHFTLARMLHHMGKNGLCRQHLDLALQVDPNYQPALDLLRDLDREQTQTSLANPAPVANP